ncbi:MAG TPA: hypothetical protein VJT73_09660 [Polyangiaceae bacterium]|nr:hypothetical protein [Polyangiaceae bacterium]
MGIFVLARSGQPLGFGTLSSRGSADKPVDRPKMAEALASLKEGLSDSDDPLYDGWKHKKGAGHAADNAGAAALDTTLDTPDPAALLSGAPTADEGPRPSVDSVDTVPVHVIRYPVFPRWAAVVAVALLLFAMSAAILVIGTRSPTARGIDGPTPTVSASAALAKPVPSVVVPTAASARVAVVDAAPAFSAPPRALVGKPARPTTRTKDDRVRAPDPSFFRDPGF